MSLQALIQAADELDRRLSEKFNGKLPVRREIIGYSKGNWLVEYTFREVGGYSHEQRWEQDSRSIEHQKKYPKD